MQALSFIVGSGKCLLFGENSKLGSQATMGALISAPLSGVLVPDNLGRYPVLWAVAAVAHSHQAGFAYGNTFQHLSILDSVFWFYGSCALRQAPAWVVALAAALQLAAVSTSFLDGASVSRAEESGKALINVPAEFIEVHHPHWWVFVARQTGWLWHCQKLIQVHSTTVVPVYSQTDNPKDSTCWLMTKDTFASSCVCDRQKRTWLWRIMYLFAIRLFSLQYQVANIVFPGQFSPSFTLRSNLAAGPTALRVVLSVLCLEEWIISCSCCIIWDIIMNHDIIFQSIAQWPEQNQCKD